jgi:DNA-binding transcriptional ArsR family regulator
MDLTGIYRSFSDFTRLRILHLLLQQPVCVCHLQDVLDLPQVNVSQHLAYLRNAGIVAFDRVQTWKIYRIVSPIPRELLINLKALSQCGKLQPIFKKDSIRLDQALKRSRAACIAVTEARKLGRLSKAA